MKVKSGFELRKVAGESVVVATGVENINFSKMISMNSTAAFLWEQVVSLDSFDVELLSKMLLEEYDVDSQRALIDSEALCKAWFDAGIVE